MADDSLGSAIQVRTCDWQGVGAHAVLLHRVNEVFGEFRVPVVHDDIGFLFGAVRGAIDEVLCLLAYPFRVGM